MLGRKTLLVLLGVAVTSGAILARRMRRAGTDLAAAAREAARGAGIAEVDPEPMTQIAGEGIDLDADRRAHREVRALRQRLPVRGDNVP
jgi:hypothetical protein